MQPFTLTHVAEGRFTIDRSGPEYVLRAYDIEDFINRRNSNPVMAYRIEEDKADRINRVEVLILTQDYYAKKLELIRIEGVSSRSKPLKYIEHSYCNEVE